MFPSTQTWLQTTCISQSPDPWPQRCKTPLPPLPGERGVQVWRLLSARCTAHDGGGRHCVQLPGVSSMRGPVSHGQGRHEVKHTCRNLNETLFVFEHANGNR